MEKRKRIVAGSKEELDAHGRKKIACLECGDFFHRIDVHVQKVHGLSVEAYLDRHPGSVILSEYAQELQARSESLSSTILDPKTPEFTEAEQTDGERPLRFGVVAMTVRKDLDPADQVFVPVSDDGFQIGPREMEIWESLAVGLKAGDNVLMVGPTGGGKDAAATQMASILNQPVRRMNCHGDISADDFLGGVRVTVDAATGKQVTEWVDGILPSAMRRGHWLILDELDAAPPMILFVLQGVLEPGHILTLTANHGEVVKPDPNFRIIATANTLGKGDDAGLYTGTHVLNESFLDRFGVVLDVGYPDQKTETKIVATRSGIPEGIASRMVGVAVAVREAFEREECYITFSTRRLIAWACKAAAFGCSDKSGESKIRSAVRRAAKLTATNKLPKNERAFVESVIQRYFGGEV